MRNIIIVECASTGINYVQDIIDRNYNPIVLELKPLSDSEAAKNYIRIVEADYELIKADFEIIYEQDSYEKTLEMVKKYDPLIIVPGSEGGVILATKLANDLGLLCNPIENIDAMTLKNEMQNRLSENNIRHIKGKVISSLEEAIDFYDGENLKEVVIKPLYGAASVGVRICLNKEEMIQSVEEVLNLKGLYGNDFDEVLIQERINGIEYIVNTMSCNGIHRISTIWKYNKEKTQEGGFIYDYSRTVNNLEIGESELIEYAYNVIDAIGIKYGPVHGEYMIDDKGPVLIEVNCRPMGAHMEAEFLDIISGQHETDSSLDCYLNPDKFHEEFKKGYDLFASGAVKSIIVPKDIIAESSPIELISNKLKSFYKISMTTVDRPHPFMKTQDLETSGGTIYLAHEDPYQLQKDLDYLRNLEKKAFQLILSEGLNKDKPINHDEDLKSLLKKINIYGTILLVTDNKIDGLDTLQTYPDELDKINGQFDCVVVNIDESIIDKNDEYVAGLFLRIVNKIKVGGHAFILQNTYDIIPSGRKGTEALLRILDLKIEIPIHNLTGIVIASKGK